MLKLENVQKNYGKFCLDCSLQVEEGCVTGLIGKNGAGKSTTFKVILGLVHADGGRAEVFGKDCRELTPGDRERIGAVLSDSGFSGYLTVKDLLPMLTSLYRHFDRERFLERCRHFEIPTDKKIKEFSTGMKRKLQVLAAISYGAELLILDEPTAGLDVVAREELLDLLREYMETEGRSILISSHISTDLEGFCDDIYMIDGGKIILHEDTDRLLSDYGVLKITEEQYRGLDRSHLLRVKKEEYGYSCLTDAKEFYLENYPGIAVEKGSVDEVITMMIRREDHEGIVD